MKQSIVVKRIGWLAGLVLLFVWNGCLDEIDFARADAIDEAIAIQGKIVKGSPSFVRVTIRGVFNFTDVPRLLDARDVTVEDENGNKLELTTRQDGVFFLEIPDDHPTFKVEYGMSYRINVSTFDNREFQSEFEELFPGPQPESLVAERTELEVQDNNGNSRIFDQLTYSINTPLAPPTFSENARLLWELETTFQFTDTPESYGRRACFPTRIEEESKTCYIFGSPITNYIALDGTELSVDRLDEFNLISTGLNSQYAEGFYLTVLQQSLSPTAFAYWSQVGDVVNRTGDIFQAPAGKVITNISNVNDPKEDVFGFFYATEEFTERVFVSPEMAGNPPLPCPAPPTEGGQAPNDCCNCSSVLRSTTQRPEWWTE